MKLNEIQAVLEEHWPFLKLELKERQDKEDSIFLRTWSIWPCLNVKTKKQVKEIVLSLLKEQKDLIEKDIFIVEATDVESE